MTLTAGSRRRRRRHTGPDAGTLHLLDARSGGLCEFAGCLRKAEHTHHRRPRRMGGTRDPKANLSANLLRLCVEHHDWVERNRARAYELGLLLHAEADPAAVPVMTRHDRNPVLLTDSGGILWQTSEGQWAPG